MGAGAFCSYFPYFPGIHASWVGILMLPKNRLPVLDHEVELVIDVENVFVGVRIENGTRRCTATFLNVRKHILVGLGASAVKTI